MNVITNTICTRFVALMAAFFFFAVEVPAAFSELPFFDVTGHVKTYSGDIPISNEIVSIFNYSTGSWTNVETDQNGNYSVSFPQESRLHIEPSMGIYGDISHPWNSLVRSDPPTAYIPELVNDEVANFTIKPCVRVEVSAPSNGPTVAGAKLHYAYPFFVDVATFSVSRVAVFYPDDFYSDGYGTIPYEGEVTLYGLGYFAKFYPQDFTGERAQYNCAAKYIDGDGPIDPYQVVVPVLDVPAEYSWDDPGGIGWSYFPATPDNRLPNNPNVVVEAEFTAMGGSWPKERIRINGTTADFDLIADNNHTTVFSFPIPECGEIVLRVEYQYLNEYGQELWFPLDTHIVTGSSNADLDNNESIDVGDLAKLSHSFFLCQGDDNYLACADFWPDGCIGLSDVPIFSDIWHNFPEDKNQKNSMFEGEVWLVEGSDDHSYTCMMEANEGWDAAVIELGEIGGGNLNLAWIPASQFEEKSILVPHSTIEGHVYYLYLIGPAPPGVLELGTLISDGIKSLEKLKVFSVELASNSDHLPNPNDDISGLVILNDATPNPFNPVTSISFRLPETTMVHFSVFDIAGRLVKTLINGQHMSSGFHAVEWDGTSFKGNPVAGGVYFYRLDAGQDIITKRMTLLK